MKPNDIEFAKQHENDINYESSEHIPLLSNNQLKSNHILIVIIILKYN